MLARLSSTFDTSDFFISQASANSPASAPLESAFLAAAFMPFIFGAMARSRGVLEGKWGVIESN